jgi:hypothetical protein
MRRFRFALILALVPTLVMVGFGGGPAQARVHGLKLVAGAAFQARRIL